MKNRLKLLRVERGWTQEQLGQALGVSRQAVNALGRRSTIPRWIWPIASPCCSRGRWKRFSTIRTPDGTSG